MPSTPEDWEEHIIDPDGFVSGRYSLTIHQGRLAILYQRHFGTNRHPRTDVRECLAWADVEQPATSADWQIREVKHGTSMGFALNALTSINDEFLLGTTIGRGLPVLVSADAPNSTEDWLMYFVEAHILAVVGKPQSLAALLNGMGAFTLSPRLMAHWITWGRRGSPLCCIAQRTARLVPVMTGQPSSLAVTAAWMVILTYGRINLDGE